MQEAERQGGGAAGREVVCDGRREGTKCSYKWLANWLGARSKEDVDRAVSGVATNVQGWQAVGFPVRKPKRTWQAMEKNATFTIQMDPVDTPVNRMLILVRPAANVCRELLLVLFSSLSHEPMLRAQNNNYNSTSEATATFGRIPASR